MMPSATIWSENSAGQKVSNVPTATPNTSSTMDTLLSRKIANTTFAEVAVEPSMI